ncbi:MAG TPA: hypothetical protein VKS81_05965, partial [Bacteroidota bacterium]|nr:hypothetical protein [Bacteroidota bacterium]
ALRALTLGLIFVGLHIAYVVRVGGDYMFARFFVPVTPILFFLIEVLALVLFQRKSIVVFGFVMLGTLAYFNLFHDNDHDGWLSNEPAYYPFEEWQNIKNLGEKLHLITEGLPLHVAFSGTYARIIYYMDPPVAIEILTGLTDTTIAHRHLAVRGRPGHEKNADPEYLHKRGVQLLFNNDMGVPGAMNQLNLLVIPTQILEYHNRIMERLALYGGIEFVKMPEFIDKYIANLHANGASLQRKDVEDDYRTLRSYYFDFNHEPKDTLREQAIVDFLHTSPTSAPQ